MNPYIRDIEGALIEVTDLSQAIAHTAKYIGKLYEQQPAEMQAFVKRRQRYWKDIFQKLGNLKAEKEADQLTESQTL
ncbi:MAG: hypothetical protein V4594_12045 [Bacteroidota bacterium]